MATYADFKEFKCFDHLDQLDMLKIYLTWDKYKQYHKIEFKEYFKNDYGFIYSFEYAERKGLLLEIMIITDQSKYSPETVYNMLKKICFNLKGINIIRIEYNCKLTNEVMERDVVSLGYLPIKDKYLETGNKSGHNLKDPIHFKACVRRASYLAKVASLDKYNYKEQVQYRKKFRALIG